MLAIAPLGKHARQTYKMAIYEVVYDLVQSLEIPPGERLVEADLAARFGVSKTPIREALLLLEKEGLVTTVPHVGATVTWLTLEDYEQRLFVLDALEQPALRLILERITSEELDRCSRLVASIREAYTAGDEPQYMPLVIQLHSELFGASRYPLLRQTIDQVQQSLRRYTAALVHPFPDTWQRELEIVTERFEHLARRDEARAADAVRRGHADLIAAARRRVDERDPAVMRYLAPSAPAQALALP